MRTDKDDQASSCSGLLLGRDHMLQVDANAPSRVFGAGTHNTLEERCDWMTGSTVFFLLPIPIIGFRRRLVEISRLRTSTIQPPSSPICFFASSHTTSPSRAEVAGVCRWWHVMFVVVGGGVAGKRRVAVALADEIWAGRNNARARLRHSRSCGRASATDAPCGYAWRGVCSRARLIDCSGPRWGSSGWCNDAYDRRLHSPFHLQVRVSWNEVMWLASVDCMSKYSTWW
jgi:hypothetical protein